MNLSTSRELGTLGPIIWVDPSGVDSPRDIGKTGWRQLSAGTRALVKFTRALQTHIGSRAYLAVSVVGFAFWRDAIAWAIATARSAVPPIVHLHTGDTGALSRGLFKRQLSSWLLKRSEIWLLSERFRDALPTYSTAFVIANGIDCPGSQHHEIVNIDSVSEKGPIHLVFLSNRRQTKGVLSVINISSELLEQHGERLRITFAGEPMDSLVEEALALLLRKYPTRISVLDDVDSEAKCQLLSSADVLIFPSRYRLEGAPLVVIEGLMHGTYCIVTEHAALPELVGTCGSVVEDEFGMINAYNTFAALGSDDRRHIKMASIERWREHYTTDIYCSRVAELVGAGSKRLGR